MGLELGIIEIVHWLTMIFPSLAEYSKIIIPMVLFFVSVICIFSNILPEPGNSYPVPSVKDLGVEFQNKAKFVYKITWISRCITKRVNRIIHSKPYKWFYNFTTACSNMISLFKGGSKKLVYKEITKPKPYVMNFDNLHKKPIEKTEEE